MGTVKGKSGGEKSESEKMAKRQLSPLRVIVAIIAALFALQSYQQSNTPALLLSAIVLLVVLFYK
jgi:hypothetical protein